MQRRGADGCPAGASRARGRVTGLGAPFPILWECELQAVRRGQRGPEPEAGPVGEATAHLCTRLGMTWTLGHRSQCQPESEVGLQARHSRDRLCFSPAVDSGRRPRDKDPVTKHGVQGWPPGEH